MRTVRRISTFTAGLAALLMLASGCGASSDNDASVSAKSSATPDSSAATVKALDAMTVDEFEKQSTSDRLTWVAAKLKKEFNEGLFYQSCMSADSFSQGLITNLNPAALPLGESATAEQIAGSEMHQEELASCWQTGLTDDADGTVDTEMSQKLVSGYVFDPSSDLYQEETQANSTLTTPKLVPSPGQRTVLNFEPQTARDQDQDVKKRASLTQSYYDDALSKQVSLDEEYAYVPVPALGENHGLWLLTSREVSK